MTTFQIDTNDKTAIEDIKKFIVEKFHFQVQVMDDTTVPEQKTKWNEFANKMDGLFTPDIIEHINHSRDEARESFTTNA